MSFVFPESPVSALDDGVWTEYQNIRVKIAYATNVRFMRAKQRLEQPYRRKIEAGTLDPADQRKLLCKAMAEAILLDWENVKNANKQDVPYSKQAAEQALLLDEAFRDFVMSFSVELGNFKADEVEHEGNS